MEPKAGMDALAYPVETTSVQAILTYLLGNLQGKTRASHLGALQTLCGQTDRQTDDSTQGGSWSDGW